MKFVIPIPNLVIENVMRLGDIIFIPQEFYNEEVRYDTDVFNDSEIAEIESIMDICLDEYQNFEGNVITLLDYPLSEKEYCAPTPDNEFMLLEKICNRVDRALDFIRLNYCQIGQQETLPGQPGIVKGFRNGIVIDYENKKCRNVLGSVYSIYVQPGIGLFADINSPENEIPDMYGYLFNSRKDEVYVNCRSALARINEAMYMNNLNSAFVYLMSTLEMAASKEYLNFKGVKSRVLPFISKSKKEYHELSEELRHISEDVRTDVVHNGKSLYDLLDNDSSVKKMLHRLTMFIFLYCSEVIESGITNFDDLEYERNRRKIVLGI